MYQYSSIASHEILLNLQIECLRAMLADKGKDERFIGFLYFALPFDSINLEMGRSSWDTRAFLLNKNT